MVALPAPPGANRWVWVGLVWAWRGEEERKCGKWNHSFFVCVIPSNNNKFRTQCVVCPYVLRFHFPTNIGVDMGTHTLGGDTSVS